MCVFEITLIFFCTPFNLSDVYFAPSENRKKFQSTGMSCKMKWKYFLVGLPELGLFALKAEFNELHVPCCCYHSQGCPLLKQTHLSLLNLGWCIWITPCQDTPRGFSWARRVGRDIAVTANGGEMRLYWRVEKVSIVRTTKFNPFPAQFP